MIDLIIDIIFWSFPILSIYSFCWAAWQKVKEMDEYHLSEEDDSKRKGFYFGD